MQVRGLSGRRAAAAVLMAAGGLAAAMAWRRMGADPLRAAAGAAAGVLAVLLNIHVVGGRVIRARPWLRRMCIAVALLVTTAVGGALLYVDRVAAPDLAERRQRMARARVPEGDDVRATADQIDAARATLPWVMAGAAVCLLSVCVAPWSTPTAATRRPLGRVADSAASDSRPGDHAAP